METIKEFLGEINALNMALIAFTIFAGGIWYKGREKLKQLGELFLAAHEYTDDKRLCKEEREDLMRRFFQLIGKPVAAPPIENKVEEPPVDVKKRDKKRRVKN
jgi:hypothetical protein